MSWLLTAVVAVLTAHTLVNARWWLRRPPARPAPVTEPVVVLLPLRDEADRVEPCLRSLLAQRDVPGLRIVILDDGSTDGTADVVRAVAAADPRVTLLTGAPLPPGWLGKPHACRQLAEAGAGDAEVLVFVDADVVLAPHAVAAAVTTLRAAGAGPAHRRTRASSPARAVERLVQPLLQWLWLTFLPLRGDGALGPAVAGRRRRAVPARSTRAGYRRCGGHAAVRDRVLEDIELARAVKRAGGADRPRRRLRRRAVPDVRAPGRSSATATASRSGRPSAPRSPPARCWRCC